MKFLVALVVALAISVADARIRRIFGSQDAQVRVYTATGDNSASAADGDCFVGKCPFDVTMPFLMGDVCPQVSLLTAPTTTTAAVDKTGNINLESLFFEFFRNTNCPARLTTLFGTDWNAYTANLEVPVYMQFIEAGVMGGSPHKQCAADRNNCGSHPNGVIRINFIFDNFCQSTCVLSPTPSPSPIAVPSPSGGAPAVSVTGGGGSVAPSPTVAVSITGGQPSSNPVIATGLGPIDIPPGGVTPSPPFIIVMPNPPPIITGTKDLVSASSMVQVSFLLPILAALVAMLF